jgi:hypothetical protein
LRIRQNQTEIIDGSGEGSMGRMRENPKYNVISMRISDEERETLEQIMNVTHKSISDIMRDAMELLKNRVTQPQINQQAA